ncbi:contact-dependent growth inhibition system immunity protein [Nocardia sp. NPDC005366]|uniref:contact-dependent growth inhibition system immunity protein n=2 Tax=Nocardia TaxID=1817 RepID=UPI0033A35690
MTTQRGIVTTEDPQSMTLEDLDGRWPDPGPDATRLVRTVHRLRRKPLASLGTEDLRVLMAQQVGVQYVLPSVIDKLRNTPLASGDFYPGDLLIATLRAMGPDFSAEQRSELRSIVEWVRKHDYDNAPNELWPLVTTL